MITYRLVYKCDYKDCQATYETDTWHGYWGTERRFESVPPGWVLIMRNNHSDELYCPEHAEQLRFV